MLPILILYLIEASDLNDAIRVASKIPPTRSPMSGGRLLGGRG
jgi:hypothetical protein